MRSFTDFANYEIVLFWRMKTVILIKPVENLKDGVKRCLSKNYNNQLEHVSSASAKGYVQEPSAKNFMTVLERVVIFLKATCGRM